MLQNFIICVNAVVPAAIYLTIGIILKFAHVVSDEEVKKFTHMVFVTLYLAVTGSRYFMASLFVTLGFPLLLYAYLFIYRLIKGRDEKDGGR